jgi:hypothetical protein
MLIERKQGRESLRKKYIKAGKMRKIRGEQAKQTKFASKCFSQ